MDVGRCVIGESRPAGPILRCFNVHCKAQFGLGLAEADVFVLLDTLIGWLIRLVSAGATTMVVKKLCSTLAVFFTRFPDKWTHCTRHLICCLCNHRTPPDAIDSCPPTKELLEKATSIQKIVALWFSAIFLEEVSKIDTRNIKNHHFRDKVSLNADEAILLIENAIALPKEGNGSHLDTRLVTEGLQCFTSWAYYSMRTFVAPIPAIDKLKALNTRAMEWLQHDETFETTSEFLTDALINYSSFFTEGVVKLLYAFEH
ncbi:hypothetical protein BDZ91DRAFT_81751 [Kalaharituber pfeilii]|nr:hypothetical protein BDZ91DRAFT_81751 [Kalaharituber pfeilii]